MATARLVMRNWEQTFRDWSKPSSDTEQEKMQNAERMVRDAIRNYQKFRGMKIEVFAQGSYRNNTNVKQECDVDICVQHMDICYTDFTFAPGLSNSGVGLVTASYTYREFKNDVEAAVAAQFGSRGIRRGDKAIDIHANSYRIDADVVACMEHRRYSRGLLGAITHISGTQFFSDSGRGIVNWPHQHYENGVGKNASTGNRFKYITRAVKRLRNEMAENRILEAVPIPSYLIECLVWNVPDFAFGGDSYTVNVRQSLAHIIVGTMTDEACKEWGEVNELKYLLRGGQPWTRQHVHSFACAAWNYAGF
jgi:hypothetical protein